MRCARQHQFHPGLRDCRQPGRSTTGLYLHYRVMDLLHVHIGVNHQTSVFRLPHTLTCTALQVGSARVVNVPLLRPLLLQAISGDEDKLAENGGPFKLNRNWI